MPSFPSSTVTIRQLRAFVAVAHEGSITRAAQRLYLTPSALSMLISALEGELAVRLFDRTTRKIALTEAGQELLPSIERVFENLESAFEGLRGFVDRRAHRFAVATSPLLASTLVPYLLASFKKRFPHVRVEILDLPVDNVAAAVRSGQAAFGICTSDMNAQDLSTTALCQDRLMLACPAGHALASLREVRWFDLCDEPLVLLRQGSGLRVLVEQGFAEIGETFKPAYEVAQVTTAIGLVQSGLGVSILPSFVLSCALPAKVVLVPLVDPVKKRGVVAICRAGQKLSESSEAFFAYSCHESKKMFSL